MARLTPEFSAGRAIRDYAENHYLPAAVAYHARAKDDGALGEGLLEWQQNISHRWAFVRFGSLDTGTKDSNHLFRVEVFSGDLQPEDLSQPEHRRH